MHPSVVTGSVHERPIRHAMTGCGSPLGSFSSSREYPGTDGPIVGFAEILFSFRVTVISHVSTLMFKVKSVYFSLGYLEIS